MDMPDDASVEPSSPAARWLRRHETACLLALAGIAVLLRAVLAVRAPTRYGYVFDFYHEAIQKAYVLGRLPASTECWQCYHPPLFTLIGLPFYAIGRWFSGGDSSGLDDGALRFAMAVPLAAGAVVAYYGYQLLRALGFRGAELVLGTAIILAFPCLFISSYALEADIVLAALMTAFLYYTYRYFAATDACARDALRIGALAGLACATKYNGLIAPAVFAALALFAALAGPHRRRLARDAVIVLAVCVAIGSWKYVDNLSRFGTPLFANGSAQQGFSLVQRRAFWRQYEFHTLRMYDLVRLTEGRVRPGPLTDVPFYRSVWTTLHAMAWGDMSLFSDPSRHGFYRKPYPRKPINAPIASAVLMLGLVPGVLSALGAAVTLRQRRLLPLAVTIAVTMAVYLAWVVAQESWALKTKYIVFLLPAYVAYVLFGLRWLDRVAPLLADAARVLLVLLLAATHVYLLDFAVR
jgi:hypothetical protein